MSYARHKECTPEQVKGFIAKYMKERITEAPEYVQATRKLQGGNPPTLLAVERVGEPQA